MSEQNNNRAPKGQRTGVDRRRRSILGAGASTLAAAAFANLGARAQSRENTQAAEKDHSASRLGPADQAAADAAASSVLPPATDHGDVPSFWYSFDLAHRRIQEGGWTNQVNDHDFPASKEVAGVKMRLTAGSYRELHWHTADEWAYVVSGTTRITVLTPDGEIFIDDVPAGDIWFFPAGFPHSLQGMGPDGTEFLLVFDDGNFSEYETFLIADWVAHTPGRILEKNFHLSADSVAAERGTLYFPRQSPRIARAGPRRCRRSGRCHKNPLYLSPVEHGPVEGGPRGLGQDRRFYQLPCRHQHRGRGRYGKTRRASRTSLASQRLGVAVLRQRRWPYDHFQRRSPSSYDELPRQRRGICACAQWALCRKRRNTDLVFLEFFKSPRFVDVSLNNWIRRVPPEMAKAHLYLTDADLNNIPANKEVVL